jgi:hypothetical protein
MLYGASDGALTQLWAGTSPEGLGLSGKVCNFCILPTYSHKFLVFDSSFFHGGVKPLAFHTMWMTRLARTYGIGVKIK